MKLLEILKPKKIALYTTLILGSSFFIVACDNDKTPTSVEKSADEMSQQQLSDFIKNSISNFITKYNQVQSFATISLESFTANAETKQITMVLKTTLVNLDDDEQPIIIDLTYLITPERTLQNNAYAVAKFVSQNILLSHDSSVIESSSFATLVKNLINDTGLVENGYFMASGDILSEIKSNNGFDYINDDAYDDLNAFNFAPSSYHYQTKENMSLVDVNYSVPILDFQFNDTKVLIKNINTQQLNHFFDEKFSYTGQNLYKIESIDINSENRDVLLKNITLDTKSNINDDGFVNQYVTSSLSGTFPNVSGQQVNFSASANMKVENLNLEASQKWEQYVSNSAFTYGNDNTEKLELLSGLFKDGFSFAITDTSIELDGVKGNFDFSFDVAPMDISSTTKPNVLFMQLLNNVTIQVNSITPAQWFITLSTGINKDYLDKMINQSIQQINTMGYEGALTYNGKNLVANFEIKKGNVFVNGELKGSLLNTLAAFM